MSITASQNSISLIFNGARRLSCAPRHVRRDIRDVRDRMGMACRLPARVYVAWVMPSRLWARLRLRP
eukprot:2610102-Pyramimonas_sp.AAC.1